ncbi:MAG: hypothetical protein FJ122_00330 [Deltaproteobacteria bacterium]|nr:hypothetical protein [Deltaproteobacteria bacterium]
MSEALKIVLMVLLTIGAFILSRFIAGWQMNKAGRSIIRDLEKNKAFDPDSAVQLPYCKHRMFRLGLKDYRPHVMKQLIVHDVVRMVEGEKYYLSARKPSDG